MSDLIFTESGRRDLATTQNPPAVGFCCVASLSAEKSQIQLAFFCKTLGFPRVFHRLRFESLHQNRKGNELLSIPFSIMGGEGFEPPALWFEARCSIH